MSENFGLMNQCERDSAAAQLNRVAPQSLPSPPYLRSHQGIGGADDMFTANLWPILRNRKWTISAFALAVVAMVMTASLLMKPKYEAVARVVVVFHRDTENGVLGFKGVDTSLLEDPEDRAAIDTQIAILETDELALQVIKDLHLGHNPQFTGRLQNAVNEDRLLRSFHNSLTVSKMKGTRVIEIKFLSVSPKLSAEVVNTLAKDYVDQYYRSQFQVSSQISNFLANQLKELQTKVEDSQQRLTDYQKENGLLGMDDKQNLVTAKLGDLNKELTAAEADRVEKEVNYRLARSGRPELLAKLEPDSLLTRLRGQQADLESQIAQASVQLGPANPKMAELGKQLAEAKRSIDAEVKRIGERFTLQYRSALGRERMLREALEGQKQAADQLNARAVQSEILKHEVETNRKLYEDLLQKQKEVGISSTLKSSNIWIVDPARPPELPAEPKIPRNFALALVFGIFGGVLLAVALEKLKENTITSLAQAQDLSSLPALGALPLLVATSKNRASRQLATVNSQGNPALVCLLQPLSPAAESYNAVLTSLLLSQPTPPEVIQVTSALPQEGKTTVSTNLAILLARMHRRVLLVDADLRRPRVHLALRAKAEAGLGALLRNSIAFEQAVTSYANLPNLFILPAGPVVLPDDTELLVCNFRDLVEGWRGNFDHIIIDTPPILPVTDAVRMSVEADSVVLVVRSGQTAKDSFLRAQDLLLSVNARLTGFVLNGAQLDSSDFRYYHGYYREDQTLRPGTGVKARPSSILSPVRVLLEKMR